VDFTLPEKNIRKKILDIILRDIEGKFDTEEIANMTEGYSGSDLRLIVREAVLSSLITERMILDQQDLLRGITEFNKRSVLKTKEDTG